MAKELAQALQIHCNSANKVERQLFSCVDNIFSYKHYNYAKAKLLLIFIDCLYAINAHLHLLVCNSL